MADMHDTEDTAWEYRAGRLAPCDTDFYILVKQADAIDIASGYVPQAIQAQVRAMLDFQREDERRAARPVKLERKTRGDTMPLLEDDSKGTS